MQAKVVERTIEYGKNHYRVDPKGNWTTLMWGWWPHGKNPSYRWAYIPEDKIPDDVKRSVG